MSKKDCPSGPLLRGRRVFTDDVPLLLLKTKEWGDPLFSLLACSDVATVEFRFQLEGICVVLLDAMVEVDGRLGVVDDGRIVVGGDGLISEFLLEVTSAKM